MLIFLNNSYKIHYINKKGITHTTMHQTYTHIYTLFFMVVYAKPGIHLTDVSFRSHC